MSIYGLPRPTPWVWRLIIANAVALLLLTALVPGLVPALVFRPDLADALRRPWTFVTYMFVHAGLIHLAFNMLVLYSLGTRVEERMGGRSFILYYLYCGLGGALFSLGLAALQPGAIAGASAAVLGVAVAYAMFWPDAELMVFPLPWPIRARTLVIALLAARPGPGAAQAPATTWPTWRTSAAPSSDISSSGSRPWPARAGRLAHESSSARSWCSRFRARWIAPTRRFPGRRGAPTRPRDDVAIETDRLLDKISGQGIASLTPAERKFLDEVSKRKRH